MNVKIKILVGKETYRYCDLISQMRLDAFQEYPYLYNGNMNYEKEEEYVRQYSKDNKSTLAIATIDEKIIAIITGIPLVSDSEIVSDARTAFSENGINSEDYYYLGEFITLPEYQGKGIANKLLLAQQELLKKWRFKYACLATVIRPTNHPLRPVNYKPTDDIWQKWGFRKNSIVLKHSWPTIQPDGTVKQEINELQFWVNQLDKSIY